ncbi:FAD-binding oxidoreductase [Mesorhizobium sp. RMAD-H1]|uniref:NAD(P)/FAD-dependent oxidoreductase n=1 Tax=Mesorhizobium sp. RMAD-H1 TaxID=2587065 RepID=UPI00160766A6|nr:FAD-binding oxidoreductase [Mesorhizobium sp. RMAD-H1]MBB2969951.1 D-amino-acid dehydrogenase [Mesorhizobium sp. RMAD-H1]
MRFDTIILGAGIIGVSTAVHLQARGRSVCLVDRSEPGEGTSFGNAGLIERSSVIPYSFPRRLSEVAKYALNRSPAMRYDPLYLPRIAPWLFRYWRESSPERLAIAAKNMLPLVEVSVTEHDFLVEQAGCADLIRARGWVETYRTQPAFEKAVSELKEIEPYGLRFEVLDRANFHKLEPALGEAVLGGIHWLDPKTVTDPAALVKAYAGLFQARGGSFVKGDAATLGHDQGLWTVETTEGPASAKEVVVALGPQSSLIFQRLGYRIPLAIKRGHHMHYAVQDGVRLGHSLVDAAAGYVLSPMRRGIRLTTGIEFAPPTAPANTIQLDRAERFARQILPLGRRLDEKPWLGLRPCLSDMRPVIGAAPRHEGLWFNFGHAHHGLTLGPASGRLLSELMTGEKPFVDPAPYSAARFGP